MSEIELSVSFSLDSERFLRRACPACSREFKWLSVEGVKGGAKANASSLRRQKAPSCEPFHQAANPPYAQ